MSLFKSPKLGLAWLAIMLMFVVSGCSTVYYSAWESLGREKRDLLRANVEGVKKDQEKVSKQFESALEEIKATYGLRDKKLEKHYARVQKEYEASTSRAQALEERIDKVREVAQDLFKEWEAELDEISDRNLRTQSRDQMNKTRDRYTDLDRALEATERRLDPVLEQFEDQVLYLKHSLNAAAVDSLEGESVDVEADVELLLADLRESIRQADAFISQLP